MECVTCKSTSTPKWYYVSKGTPTCCACYSKQYRKSNPDVVKQTLRRYESTESAKARKIKYEHTSKGSDVRKKVSKTHRNKLKDTGYYHSEEYREIKRRCYHKNVEHNRTKSKIKTAKRRSLKLNATPEWASEFDFDAIYRESSILGDDYEVDHIIPLKHELVCGLHVPWNLQILNKQDNRSKRNKFDGTYNNDSWREQ